MRKYSKEYKEEALKLSDVIGVKKAASQLGLQYYTLAEWRKNRKAETKLPDRATDAEQRAKIRELERENSELRQANEILKDALGFYGFNLLKLKTRKK
jgi:transposase